MINDIENEAENEKKKTNRDLDMDTNILNIKCVSV